MCKECQKLIKNFVEFQPSMRNSLIEDSAFFMAHFSRISFKLCFSRTAGSHAKPNHKAWPLLT